MIVITNLSERVYHTLPGDVFCLKVTSNGTEESVIEETITQTRTLDFICSFRFAADDGTVQGFHLSGFFGDKNNLPDEMKNAVMMDDLPPDKKKRFTESAGIKFK